MQTSWKQIQELKTNKLEDLASVADTVLALLGPRTILLLEGPVGAGKTEFVKALARKLGTDDAASPSYAIHHRYENPSTAKGFDHVDLYRLEDEDDLESTGFWDLFQQERGLVVIEWPERLNVDHLPFNWLQIKLCFAKAVIDSERVLQILARA